MTADQSVEHPDDGSAPRGTSLAHGSADASIAGEASKHAAPDVSAGIPSRTERVRTRQSYDTVAERYNEEIGDELTAKPWD